MSVRLYIRDKIISRTLGATPKCPGKSAFVILSASDDFREKPANQSQINPNLVLFVENLVTIEELVGAEKLISRRLVVSLVLFARVILDLS